MEQIDLFSYTKPQYKITKPIRLIELFGGIGSQAVSLRNLGVDFERYKMVEIDSHCVDSYNAIHHTNFIPQDITKIHASDLEIRERERVIHTFLHTHFHVRTYLWLGN